MLMNGGDDLGALVVDVGSQTTRVGYAGEDSPKQLWNSCVGIRQNVGHKNTGGDDKNGQSNVSIHTDSNEIIFPLCFLERYDHTDVKPCLFTDPATGCYCLHEDVFETIIGMSCESNRLSIGDSRSRHRDVTTISGASDYASSYSVLEDGLSSSGMSNVRSISSLSCGLGENLSEKPILLTEPNVHSRSIRRKMAEIMFECFECPAVYLAKRSMLTSFAMGRSSGLVVDIGAGTTSIAPVTDGYVLSKHLLEYPIGGNTLDSQFSYLLADREMVPYPMYGVNKTIRDVGKSCEVTRNDCSKVLPTYLHYSQMEVIRHLKEAVCRVAEDDAEVQWAQSPLSSDPTTSSILTAAPLANTQFHELPDGTRIDADHYMFRVPEVLFSPKLIRDSEMTAHLKNFSGLSVAVSGVLNHVDSDFRKEMLNAIILTGGCSMLTGLPERLNRHLQEEVNPMGGPLKLKVIAAQGAVERRYSTWVGGSILASLGSFQQIWMSLEEYREHGSSLVERKCV